MTIQYHRCGDYLLPNLIIEDQKTQPIGKYGRIRKRYLKEHRPVLYTNLLLSGELFRIWPRSTKPARVGWNCLSFKWPSAKA